MENRAGKQPVPKQKKKNDTTKDLLGLKPSLEDFNEGLDETMPLHPNRTYSPTPRPAHRSKTEHRPSTILSTRSDSVGYAASPDENTSLANIGEINVFPGRDLLKELSEFKGDICLSIFIPTHSQGAEIKSGLDQAGFKDALQQSRQKLRTDNIDDSRIEQMLSPAFDLLNQKNFWKNQAAGLAVYIAPGYLKYCRLPFSPKPEVFINSAFLIKPLIPLVSRNEYFYILSLSKNSAHLYYADGYGIRYIEIPEMPAGMQDIEGSEVRDTSNNVPDEKTSIARYMKEVDKTLHEKVLVREQVPLLLAGVEYLLPIFRSTTSYHNVVDEEIHGNHEHTEPPVLYSAAIDKMRPFMKKRLRKSLSNYYDRLSTAFSSSILTDIVPAAYYGQVDTLFVEEDVHLYGHFDDNMNKIVIHPHRQAGDDCLIDKAILQTIVHGGEIYLLNKEDMPAESLMAAVFRYA